MDAVSEEWRSIYGYEGYYEVSNLGKIRSLTKSNGHGSRIRVETPRILNNSKTTTGYFKIDLFDERGRKGFKVHRLVAFAFIPNPLNLPCVNHLDENPINNSFDNLEWCTHTYNVRYSLLLHRRSNRISIEQENEVVALYKEGKTGEELADKYNISHTTVYRMLRNSGLKPRTVSEAKDKYGIDIAYFKKLIDSGTKNKEIVKIFNCSRDIVATRKYQYKRGVI